MANTTRTRLIPVLTDLHHGGHAVSGEAASPPFQVDAVPEDTPSTPRRPALRR
jgi:hypothetical protein